MKIRRTRRYQLFPKTKTRALNITTSLVMVVSSLSGALPLVFARTTFAAPDTTYTPVSFSGLSLTPDRSAPSGGSSVSSGALMLNVDTSKANTASSFYQTEGLHGTIAPSKSIEASLYVDSSWSTKQVRAGLWGVAQGQGGTNDLAYPIIEYTTIGDGGFHGFRVFNTINGGWTNLTAVPVATGQAYSLEIADNATTGTFDYYINDAEVLSLPAVDTTANDSYNSLNGVIFDNWNPADNTAADNYSVEWTNLKTGAELLAPSAFQMLDNTHNNYAHVAPGVVSNTANPAQFDLTWPPVTGASHYITTTYLNGVAVGSGEYTGTPNAWVGVNGGGFGLYGDGSYTFRVCAYASHADSGNCATTGAYIYDHMAPSDITATYTGGLSNVTTPTPVTGKTLGGNLTFQISETEANPSYMYAEINWLNPATNKWEKHAGWGTALTTTSGTLTLPSTAPSGTYQLKVSSIRDQAGNTASTQTFGFTVDNDAPTGLTNVSPTNGTATTTAKQVLIDWTDATDVHGPVAYYYESSASSATNSDGSFVSPAYQSGALSDSQISTLNTPAGVYYWHVRAVDSLGNSTAWTDAWKLTVDNTKPVVSFGAPSDFTKPFAAGPNVTVNATDLGSGLSVLAIHVYDSSNKLLTVCGSANAAELAAGSMSCDLSGLADGTYSIKAGATDKAGNNTTLSSGNFTIDRTKPVVADNFNISLFTGDTTTLAPTVTGESGTLTYAWTPSDNKLLTNQNETLSGPTLEIGNAPKGNYTVGLTVTDQAGNVTTETYNVTIADHGNNSQSNVQTAHIFAFQAPSNNSKNGGTNGGAGTQVLGDSTDTPSTPNAPSSTGSGSTGQVKGDSTVNFKNADGKKSSNFLFLGWWWLAVLVAFLAMWLLAAYRRSDKD